MRRSIALFAFGSLLCAAPVSADEFRLTDGRVVVGKAKVDGDRYTVTTRDGVVSFTAADIASHRTRAELVTELNRVAKMSGASPNHQLQLAKTAFSFGLTDRMWKYLDRCVEKLPADRTGSTAKRYRKFLATLEPEVLEAKYRNAETKLRVRALTRKVRMGSKPSRRDAVLELLAQEPGAAEHLRFATRRATIPEQRLVAIEALLRRAPKSRDEQEANQAAVCRSLVLDKDKDVRVDAAGLVGTYGDVESVVQYLAPGFLHDHPSIRGRTAQAFGNLGDLAAAPYLVAAGPLAGVTRAAAAGGGYQGVRAHMFSRTQRAYIRDFEVEIAQASAVANPVIGTADNGVVLDVVVGGVPSMRASLEKAYRRALQKIVGDDPGPYPSGWADWWRGRQPPAADTETGQARR